MNETASVKQQSNEIYDNCFLRLQLQMSRRLILTIIVNLLLLISVSLIIILLSRSESENDQTSQLRLAFLLGVHGIFFIALIVMLKIEQIYNIILVIFICLFITSTSMYICELMVQVISRSSYYQYNHYAESLEKLELTYLNLYFLIYMYSLIGCIPSGLFLISTEGLMCWQEYLINKHKERCLKKIVYSQSIKYMDCSICLAQFNGQENDHLLEIINCGHIFHEKCLCEWLRYNTKCPMDRRNIFDINQEEE